MTVPALAQSAGTMTTSDSRMYKLLLGQGAPPQVAALIYVTTDLWYQEKDPSDAPRAIQPLIAAQRPRVVKPAPAASSAPASAITDEREEFLQSTRITRSQFLMMWCASSPDGDTRLPAAHSKPPAKLPSLVGQAPVPAGLSGNSPNNSTSGPASCGAMPYPPSMPPTSSKLIKKELVAGDFSGDDMTDVDSELEPASDGEEPVQVLVGPSQLASAPWVINDLWLEGPAKTPGGQPERIMITSTASKLLLSETRLLTLARPDGLPISFGSVVHLRFGKRQPCRSCMFEKSSTRSCRRSWLCDFCHLHTRGSGNNANLQPQPQPQQQQQQPQQKQQRPLTKQQKATRGQMQDLTTKRGLSQRALAGHTSLKDAFNQGALAATISTMDSLPLQGRRATLDTLPTLDSLPYVNSLSMNSLPQM